MALNRKYALLPFFTLLVFSPLFAQQEDSARSKTEFFPQFDEWQLPGARLNQGSFLMLNGSGWLNSSHAPLSLESALYQGNSIGKEKIQSSLLQNESKQVSGLELGASVQWIKIDSTRNGFYLGFRDNFLQGLRYTGAAYNLFMAGNAPYEGENLNLHPLQAASWRYMSLSGGIIRQRQNRYGNVMMKVGLGLKAGFDYVDFRSKALTLYTASYGEYLQSEANFTLDRSGRQSGIKGYGLGLDFYYSVPVSASTFISFSVNDLGAMAWNSSSIQYRADSVYRFDGYYFDGRIPGLDLNSGEVIDSIIGLYLPDSTIGSKVAMLPGAVQVMVSHQLNQKLTSIGGLQYRWGMARLPRLQAGVLYRPRPESKWQSVSSLSIGGFGGWDVNQQFIWQFAAKAQLSLSIFSIEGLILPNTLSGGGAALGVVWGLR